MHYPSQLAIQPLTNVPHAAVRVPGSKSITNRAMVLAALTGSGDNGCQLDGVLESEDTLVMAQCLERLGFNVDARWADSTIHIPKGSQTPLIPSDSAELFVANSGTTMRFLTALVSLGHGRYRLDGVPRMRERPIQDLLEALTQLGVKIRCENQNGCPPVIIDSNGLHGGRVSIKGSVSSQFLSGLLMAAPFAGNELYIEVDGPLVSVPYVDMTLAMMRQFGLEVEAADHRFYRIPGRQTGGLPRSQDGVKRGVYRIEPDASAASYFFAAAAITGGSITVGGLTKTGLQGDVRFVEVLELMGCRVECRSEGITVHGGPLHGIDVDMNDISDTVMTLGVVACFAEGSTIIRNVGHIRHKETDRLAALATELRRIGALVEEHNDGLKITPAPLRGATIETYDDHRMAMSLALAGLKIPGIIINHPACVGKTYPGFFDDLDRLR